MAGGGTDRQFLVPNEGNDPEFCSNKIVNTKYTLLTFLPKICYVHFRRFMPWYFLLIGVLQTVKWAISPVHFWTTWAPIVFSFAVFFLREFIDECRRCKADQRANCRRYDVIRKGVDSGVPSETIRVGDIVRLRSDHESPADVIVLSVDGGDCFIETANLDGETKYKRKTALEATATIADFSTFSATVQCGQPTGELYNISGTLQLRSGARSRLQSANFIPAGCYLRQCAEVRGLVCYTGKETKLGINSKAPPVKTTQLDRYVDYMSLIVFGVQIVLAGVAGKMATVWRAGAHLPYLMLDHVDEIHPKAIGKAVLYLRCFLLTSTMISVSLRVTLDVCKFCYAFWIKEDRQLICSKYKLPAIVNNTSVIENLGSVEFLFSDKTGTLTENVMVFRKLGIVDDDQGFVKDCAELQQLNFESPTVRMAIVVLALCHSVYVKEDGILIGESPEEMAFLHGFENVGIRVNRMGDDMRIYSEELNLEMEFEIIATAEFSPEFRRMRVLVQSLESNEFFLLTKGAPDVLAELSCNGSDWYSNAFRQLALSGYRTMGLSCKQISPDEIEDFRQAVLIQSTSDSSQEICNLMERNERDSTLVGLAAIEDLLQEGVQETISILRKAGIRTWMLTGHCLETSVSVAYSAELISPRVPFLKISNKTLETIGMTLPELLERIEEYVATIDEYCLAIESTGDLLPGLTDSKQFLGLALNAKCVICATISPMQKGEYVNMVRAAGKLTFAIGDGGNDVTMIRAAHIGVGILGREGRQAAMAADIAVSRFRFLKRLLLIHGRFAGYRTSWLSQFCFYKSALFSFIQVSYMLQNGA
jgi:phospholipid-translocating ATPase